MQGFILLPATGPYVQQSVRVHCIILHRSACSRGYKHRSTFSRVCEREESSQVSARVIEASANIVLRGASAFFELRVFGC